MKAATVTGLWIYPVKSCRGISLNEMQIGPTGPAFDRRWMLVDENNKFLTLRTLSKLAEIKTAMHGNFLHLYAGNTNQKILIDITKDCETTEHVTVWNDTFKAGIESPDVNEALSEFLMRTVKLVRYQTDSFRDIKAAATDVVKETMFADGRPILLTNVNSLNDLNEKLVAQGKDLAQMERFRANIIIEGWDAFSEDQVSEFEIGNVRFANPKLCARCPVITQDIETGQVVSKETLKTLASYRQVGAKPGVMFGVNLTPARLGTIRVGDKVRAITTR